MKTPTYYKAPLRKRSEIREYLTDDEAEAIADEMGVEI